MLRIYYDSQSYKVFILRLNMKAFHLLSCVFLLALTKPCSPNLALSLVDKTHWPASPSSSQDDAWFDLKSSTCACWLTLRWLGHTFHQRPPASNNPFIFSYKLEKPSESLTQASSAALGVLLKANVSVWLLPQVFWSESSAAPPARINNT